MPGVEDVLNNMEEDVTTYDELCLVDSNTRRITIPETLRMIGVEHDKDVVTRTFKMQTCCGDVDMSAFDIYVTYNNAHSECYVYNVPTRTIEDGYMIFDWLIPAATVRYQGIVNFVICLKSVSGETLLKEWNSTLGQFSVLEGLASDAVPTDDELGVIYQLINQANAAVAAAAASASSAQDSATAASASAATATDAIGKTSYIGENGSWFEWRTAAFVDTGVAARGPAGGPGPQGYNIGSVYRKAGTGAAGTTDTYGMRLNDTSQTEVGTFSVYNGANGSDGDVQTVNSILPDEQGNVVLTPSSIGAANGTAYSTIGSPAAPAIDARYDAGNLVTLGIGRTAPAIGSTYSVEATNNLRQSFLFALRGISTSFDQVTNTEETPNPYTYTDTNRTIARKNLGAAAGGIWPVSMGGTGVTSLVNLLTALGSVDGIWPASMGGTGVGSIDDLRDLVMVASTSTAAVYSNRLSAGVSLTKIGNVVFADFNGQTVEQTASSELAIASIPDGFVPSSLKTIDYLFDGTSMFTVKMYADGYMRILANVSSGTAIYGLAMWNV